jgi:serine/threonine protein kinase
LRRVRRIYGGPGCRELIHEKLTQEIEILKNRYPENNLLYSTVRKMLDINPNKRPTFLGILEKLPDYKLIKKHFIENGDSLPVEVDVRELFNLTKNSRQNRPISRSRNQSTNSLVPRNYGGFSQNGES